MSSQIIGVVVTAAEAIGAQDTTSLDFFAEPFAAALGIDVDCIFRTIAARRVTNAIISGEVGGSFGGGDNVIDGDRKIGRGERNVDDLVSFAFVEFDRFVDQGPNFVVHAFPKEFLGQAQSARLWILFENLRIGRNLCRVTRGVERIVSGNSLKQKSGVFHGLGERANLVEGRSKRSQAIPRYHTVGGLHSNDPAERSRLSNRSSGIRAEGQRNFPSGHRRGASPAASTGYAFQIPRIPSRAISRVLGRRTHCKLVQVEASADHGAGFLEFPGDGRIVGRYVVL